MLFVMATPIGNLEDMSPRAIRIMGEADVLACEDTRRTRGLLTHFEIASPGRVVSYREQTERRLAPELAEQAVAGSIVVLCTDGGYPGVSDPGYRLIREVATRGGEIQVVPGPSACTVALLASGLSTSSYTFKGFPPRKKGQMARFFEEEKEMPHTLVIYESPMRVGKSLAIAHEVYGDREAAVCIELTKKFERVSRGYLGDLAEQFAVGKVKGEVTIVIAGNNPKFSREGAEAEAAAQAAASGAS